jgi:uncharacterized protein
MKLSNSQTFKFSNSKMPIIKPTYKAPLLFQNPHISTLYASVLRRVDGVNYTRERLNLSDGDFVDLDWSCNGSSNLFEENGHSNLFESNNLVIITHGFLGNSQRQYVKGTVKAFNEKGWDALAWNHRGLSGEPNLLEKMTTHGSTFELSEIVEHVLKLKKYKNIALVGWSKGGNITLKYAGEIGNKMPTEVRCIVGVSMPTDLYGSVQVMGKTSFYANRFRDKTYKFLQTRKHFIDDDKFKEFSRYKTLDDFADYYIAPLHGYNNAKDYYLKCSASNYLESITVPTLILNALNDPILSMTCSPFQLAKSSEIIHLETPNHGGHCAFYESNKNGIYWADRRVLEFVNEKVI